MRHLFNPDLFQSPFRFYMRKHSRAFALGVGALLFTNFFDVLTPLALKAAIDAITAKNQVHLVHAILIFLALMAGVMTFRFLWRVYFGKFHHSVANDVRMRIFHKLSEFGPTFYQKNPTGQLMSLVTNDVNSFRMAIGPGTLILLDAAFLIAMILPVMVSLSWDWTWKTLLFLPLVPPFMRKMEALIHTLYRIQQDRLADVSARAQEIISGIRVIKGFAQEQNQLQSFNVLSREYELSCNRMAKVDAIFQPVMEFAVAIGSVTLLWLCTPTVIRGTVTLGTFVAFHEYIKRMTWPMSAIGLGVSMYEQGRASFDRIASVLTTPTDIPDTGDTVIDEFKSIEFRNVSFTYPGAPVRAVEHIQLTVSAGETIGIVGPVGAGKTTLLMLLTRLLSLRSTQTSDGDGQIYINDTAIENITRRSLANLISTVPQDAFLFSDTVADNVGFGFSERPPQLHIEQAATMVNIDREIDLLPEKYHSFLGERGVNLSGGQKQRLTIARAMIRRSPVVILDDSLSAVDAKTEKSIVFELKAARAQNKQQTVLIISHRLATLKHADRIVVMQKGQIEAIGTHTELLNLSPTYRRLNELQDQALNQDLLQPESTKSSGEKDCSQQRGQPL